VAKLGWSARRLRILSGILAGCVLSQTLRAADGDLDPSFGVGGKVVTSLGYPAQSGTAMALDPNGRIVVTGWTFDNSANLDFGTVRYDPDGSLDPSFGTAGAVVTEFFGFTDIANAVAIQGDGKIVVGGSAATNSFFGQNIDFAIARYNTDGSLDTSFGGDGKVTTDIFGPTGNGDIIYAIAVQPDGKIVAAGTSVVRYNADGTLDQTFGAGGIVETSVFGEGTGAVTLALQPNGKILIAGAFAQTGSPTYDDWLLARFDPDGVPDASFGSKGFVKTDFFGRGDVARRLAVLPDGRIVAGGSAGDPAGPGGIFAVARYLADGTLDVTFGGDGRSTTDFPGFDEVAFGLAVQPDGKVLLAGTAANPDFTLDFALARYDANGVEDSTFGDMGIVRTDFFGGSDGARAVAVQSDGKILAAGGASFGGFFAVARYSSTSGPPAPPACPRSAGFWRKQRGEWPVDSLTLGSQSYPAAEVAELLKTPIRGDASLLLARELIASKFNLAGGAGSPELSALVSSADAILSGFSGRLPYRVPPGSAAGRSMVALSGNLASWNNRRSSPGCKD
jgi:uncharacterized delta-60 repeat protein